MKHNIRGQVTVFMIIGIILLFSTALIFYIKEKVQIPEEQLIPSMEQTPDLLKPIKYYVEQCASQKLEEGIKTAMEHGGLIYTDNLDTDPIDPTSAEGVEYFPGSNYKIPYWSYMKSDNDCTSGCVITTQRPPLCKAGRESCISTGRNSIEEQLERYLKENMKDCISGFKPLKEQGYTIKENSNLTAKVSIRQKDAIAIINYELDVDKAGANAQIKDYYSTVRTRIADMYEIATDIINYTSTNCFYERYSMDLLASYGGFGEGQIPPMVEMRLEKKRYTWSIFDVKEKLKSIFANMIQLVRFNNTLNYGMPVSNYTGEYKFTKEAVISRTNNFALDKPYDVEVRTNYFPWWDIFVDIKPNENGKIGPSNEISSSGDDSDFISQIFKLLNYKEYIYIDSYKVSYPLVTEIYYTDEQERRWVFRFAQEANLRGTTCMKPSTEMFSSTATDTQTILCDMDMRKKDNTTIEVYDEFNTTKPLDEVQVSFYAGETCLLGYTDKDGKLTVNMPEAYGWFLSFEKEGYLRNIVHESDAAGNMKIYLKPLLAKKINFRVINASVVESIKTAATTREALEFVRNSSEDLLDTDKIIMTLERVKDSYQDGELKKFITVEDGKIAPEDFIELTKGTYSVEIRMSDKRNHTIVRELDRVCEEAGFGGDCVKTPRDPGCQPRGKSEEDFKNGDCYKMGYTCESVANAIAKNSDAVGNKYWQCVVGKLEIVESAECNLKKCKDEEGIDEDIFYNETNVTDIINGGLVLDNSTQYFKILDEDRLLSSENITFYIFRQEIPTRHYELEDLMIHEDWSRSYSMYVMPELK